ncbi:hypothetical protein [Bowmanella dokdonensis]|uniref:Uncharacterized protein n=1 Tax=Bowmanella dokdonensis TaxID=751969 RepID=A0A939DP37_9ALTE|nr:hypothetical protein [Bowmanella dokdonensis]MBN7826088.1 hypothetical protein [Bowmanella dokdonensis]
MSDANVLFDTIPVRFGRSAAVAAVEQRLCELQARVTLCNELMLEEPEFRYEHELERDWLLRQISEHQFDLCRLNQPSLRRSA